jgi:hypothetical protein
MKTTKIRIASNEVNLVPKSLNIFISFVEREII